MTAPTFPTLLADQVRRSGARPFVTFYDDATGERVELSVVTFANWVAKTASLLQDELDLERGSTVLIDLPTHWLGPVWLGAAWSLGACVRVPATPAGPSGAADLVVCGPERVAVHAGGSAPVVALSLLPMGARFATALPQGVIDYGAVVWGQPDAFVPYEEPGADDPAWATGDSCLTQEDLLTGAASEAGPGGRLLTDVNPCSADGIRLLLGPLLHGGGTVWVRHPDPTGWEHRAETEQATTVRQPPRS